MELHSKHGIFPSHVDGRPYINMADSSDSVVSNNTNNFKDLSAVQSSDKIDETRTDNGKCIH